MGRNFFEEVIRENLDLGRPSQVSLIFDRKINHRIPGRLRTVITNGVVPSLHGTCDPRALRALGKITISRPWLAAIARLCIAEWSPRGSQFRREPPGQKSALN